jgi:hypothetical protein
VEDALGRLDILTKEENLMTVARTLNVVHHVDQSVTAIKVDVCDVGDNVKENTELIHRVNDNVTAVKGLTSNIHDRVNVIDVGMRSVGDDVREMKQGAQHIFELLIDCTNHFTSQMLRQRLTDKDVRYSLTFPPRVSPWLKLPYRDPIAKRPSNVAESSEFVHQS